MTEDRPSPGRRPAVAPAVAPAQRRPFRSRPAGGAHYPNSRLIRAFHQVIIPGVTDQDRLLPEPCMTRRTRIFVGVGAALVLLAVGWFIFGRTRALVLTGIVTTNDVVVSPLVGGQVGELYVREGDSVAQNQLIARLVPAELQADQAYYTHTAEQGALEVQEGEASLRYQEMQTAAQINQAQATLATATAQQAEAQTNVTNTKRTLDRYKSLLGGGGLSEQDVDQAQTAYDVATARLDAANKEIEAQRAALALAQSAKEQIAVRRNALVAAEQEHAAAAAQSAKANVRLSYTDLRAPIAGHRRRARGRGRARS